MEIDKNKAVFGFIKTYPPLQNKLNYNALVQKLGRYSMSTITSDTEIKRYTGNLVKKQFIFAITAIKKYDAQGFTDINLDELYEFDKFSKWVKDKWKEGQYPNIGNVTKMKASNPTYDGNDGKDTAKYSFMLTIEYLEQEE